VKDLDLAGSVGALKLIAHCEQLYKGKRLGAFFTKLRAQIVADQHVLRELMTHLGIAESKVRQAGAWVGDKLCTALLAIVGNERNGLGLLLILEALFMGITGKGLLWRALSAANLPELAMFDFEKLRRRAEEQMKRAQAEQIRSARRALVDKSLWRGDGWRS